MSQPPTALTVTLLSTSQSVLWHNRQHTTIQHQTHTDQKRSEPDAAYHWKPQTFKQGESEEWVIQIEHFSAADDGDCKAGQFLSFPRGGREHSTESA